MRIMSNDFWKGYLVGVSTMFIGQASYYLLFVR